MASFCRSCCCWSQAITLLAFEMLVLNVVASYNMVMVGAIVTVIAIAVTIKVAPIQEDSRIQVDDMTRQPLPFDLALNWYWSPIQVIALVEVPFENLVVNAKGFISLIQEALKVVTESKQKVFVE